jgi:hypothetical protein
MIAICVSAVIISGVVFTFFCVVPKKALRKPLELSRSTGLRMPLESIEKASVLSAAHHEVGIERANRPHMKSAYNEPNRFILEAATGVAQWQHAMPLTRDGSQWSAHFLLDAIDVIDATGEIGARFFIADKESKDVGSYLLRIDIVQKRPSSKIKIYSADGTVLSGDLPMWLDKKIKTKKPYLPWHDGMKIFYSIVCQKRREEVMLFFIQHTLDQVHNYTYASDIVREVVRKYAGHERLQNRPKAYLDQVSHMRCLPIPYRHEAYAVLAQSAQLWVSFAVLTGTIEITPG